MAAPHHLPPRTGADDPPEFDAVSLATLRRRTSEKWRTYPPDVLPAFVAELDVPLAGPIRQALHEAVELGDTGYAVGAELPEAFADFAGRRFGWAVDPARLRVVPDVMVGAAEILRVATPPGAGVVINPPVYPPFTETIEEVGRRPVPVPLIGTGSGWDLDLPGVEAAFRAGARAYLLCNPHNPTGQVWPEPVLRRVAELAERYHVLVLSDEIHAPLTLPGARHTPYLAAGGPAAAEHGIVLTSASKAWNLAGLKCAVAVTGSADMQAVLDALPTGIRDRVGLFGVLAATAAFRDGEPWLDALLHHLDRNRRLLAGLLADTLPGARYAPPAAGYVAWLDCTDLGLGADPAAVFLARGRVALSSGLDFGQPGAGYVRLNFGTSAALVTEAVRRMAAALVA